MGSTFLYPPAKRTVPVPAMPDPTTSNKRSKPPSSSLPVPPGHVSFRLLCHSSRTGGVIGKSGSVIKQLQQETGSKIRIEEAPPESPDRVITIVAPSSGGVSSGELFQVSKGQEALVRVFERILAVAAESDSAGMAAEGGVASCRLLEEASHVGSVIGKGGKIVEKIRKDCGVKIRVLTDKLPVCAGPTEEVIEIEGEVVAVKKALLAVSRCLQECQLANKTWVTGIKHVELGPQDPLLPVHVEIPAQYNPAVPMLPNRSISYAPVVARSLALDSDRVSSTDSTNVQQSVVFRILSSNDRIGAIIGKGGNVIKGIQNETGATITIGNALAECDDRLITVTASESPESRYSAAQKTVVLVFSRAVDAATEKGLESASSRGSSVIAKLVISSNQIGCLLGKGGTIISEMRQVTGASIRIVGGDQVPKCMPTKDHVVQISGDFMSVKDAIYHVTGRLRDNLFSSFLSTTGTRNSASIPSENSPYLKMRDPLQEPLRDTMVRDPLRDSSLGDPLRDSSLRDPLRDPPLRYPLRDASLRDPLRESSLRDPSLRDLLRDPLRNPLRDGGRDTLIDPFRDTLMEPLRNTLSGPPGDSFRRPIRDSVSFSLPLSRGISHSLSQHHITQNMDHLGLSHSVDHPPSPRLWASQAVTGVTARGISDVGRGLDSASKGGFEHSSGSKSAFVTNTTVEIVVPANVFGSVYGESGGNLARLRQMSGARVIVHEPRLGTSDRIIVISGTPDETQAAQSLLQAFILTGQP